MNEWSGEIIKQKWIPVPSYNINGIRFISVSRSANCSISDFELLITYNKTLMHFVWSRNSFYYCFFFFLILPVFVGGVKHHFPLFNKRKKTKIYRTRWTFFAIYRSDIYGIDKSDLGVIDIEGNCTSRHFR